MKPELWEILVPASNNKDSKFSYEHHKEWDAFVKKITNGVTITRTAKGNRPAESTVHILSGYSRKDALKKSL